MKQQCLRVLIYIGALMFTLGATNARAQDNCRADSASSAVADSLMISVGDQIDSSTYAKVRRAVEVAPLTLDRWKMIWQVALFAHRPDTAVALATLALQRWPHCAVGDTALVQAKALLAGKRLKRR